MTDLHTHILPGMDDGAKTVEESLALLALEREQGVDTVVLTPHFYRNRENPAHFLERRKKAADTLREALASRGELPRVKLGAEVAWWPGLADCGELNELCIEGTKTLLVELPFSPWSERMVGSIYDLMGRTGVTPVIAHLERYLKGQRAELVRDVLDLGVPVQVSGDVLLEFFKRGPAMKLLKADEAQLVASDCHNTSSRAPNLGDAMRVVEKKLGREHAAKIARCADRLAGV